MRKFLVERDWVISLPELMQEWEEWARDDMTFEQYLADCLSKNGALTEILTDDTPRENSRDAVTLIRVWYSDDVDDYCDEWLTEEQAHEKFPWTCGMKVLDA